jgi:hypothetical protein
MPAKTTKQSEDAHNPYGYSEMDWAAQLDPAYATARAEVRRLSVGEEGTLSVKVKELIMLGILASRGLQYGVEAHMRRALDYGATKENLAPCGRTFLVHYVPDAPPMQIGHDGQRIRDERLGLISAVLPA